MNFQGWLVIKIFAIFKKRFGWNSYENGLDREIKQAVKKIDRSINRVLTVNSDLSVKNTNFTDQNKTDRNNEVPIIKYTNRSKYKNLPIIKCTDRWLSFLVD